MAGSGRRFEAVVSLGTQPTWDVIVAHVEAALAHCPHSSTELGVTPDVLRAMESKGLIRLDPDRFPDRFVPGNPLVARLPDDERPWPGWDSWNV